MIPSRKTKRSVPLLVAALLAATLAGARSSDAAFPGLNGKIAFDSNRDGNGEIYVMNADGSDPTRLTNNPATDGAPVWSADGTQITFESTRSGNFDVFTMNSDGTGQAQLTTTPGIDGLPAWSPDGERIAFHSQRAGNVEIFAMNSAGGDLVQLTNTPAFEFGPAWSPDGTEIAFISLRDGNIEIYSVTPDGSASARLTNNPATEDVPNWSPDGSQLAFATDRDGNFEIYVMNRDGTNPRRLTNNPARDFQPAWSPDGTRIAFESNRDGNSEIYVMDADGGNQTRVTNSPARDIRPDWQPIPDTTPPTVTVPNSVTADATSPAGAVVSYTASATDDQDPAPTIACAPASGNLFPIGDTAVTCTASDASGNSATASFLVHVRGAASQLDDLIGAVEAMSLEPQGVEQSFVAQLDAALDAVAAGDLEGACDSLQSLIDHAEAQRGKKLTETQADTLVAAATRIRQVLACA